MGCTESLRTRVSPEVKRQALAIADRDLLTEAAWIKQLVLREIRACDAVPGREPESNPDRRVGRRGGPTEGTVGGGKPMLVRLRAEDRLLLDARAEARGMRPATYVSVLIRAHMRSLTPLPKDELLALKQSISELASIGRNINQIARALNAGRAPQSVQIQFRTMLKLCEALRDHTKGLLKANETSWRVGQVRADR